MDNRESIVANQEELKEDDVAVVIVPLILQSHLRQLLHLACRISSYGLPVYYLGSATSNSQARLRSTTLNPSDIAKIHFHDLQFDTQDPPPDIPIHVWNASMRSREPIASFLRDISSKVRRVVVIHDLLMSYNIMDISSLPNGESYVFYCLPIFDMYCSHYAAVAGLPIPLEEELLKKLPSNDGCYNPEDVMHHSKLLSQCTGFNAGDIYNTSQVIEGNAFIDSMAHLASIQNKKLWTLGPIQLPIQDLAILTDHLCLDWLNKQPPKSVLYVSFGTSTSFSAEQIKEIAIGLELSKQRFIWVLRNADKGDPVTNKCEDNRTVLLVLPEGFEERVKGVGLVVRDWAPQQEILAHSSTGGFMSHCGWTSCLESIIAGVPVAAWPIQFDQPKNSFLLAEILKIGLLVRVWEKREELVAASTIQNIVCKLMASEEGDMIRKRAQELSEAIRRSTEKGGVSRKELESFAAHITR
ncbi:putative L-gulonolactone oxidase-like [Capsicum annuum]|uniref:zeatin O-xylosyltransferase n=1 Tax=Capsicum annuum TaxID=4072 RepID=UPI0007BF8515|nr:zeatin O-xylosyltransferase [Capsicum annuum]KAF3627903.1 putative L-gulonolactone oxidase-like [Capsicum annuum]KAF3677680.1 putative L-gulonolactone oxidase-like [Capsicum annuum]